MLFYNKNIYYESVLLTFLLWWKVIKLLHKYILWFMTLTVYESTIGKHLTFPCIMSDSLWVNIRPTYILACLFILHLHKDLMRGITNKYPSFCKTTKCYSAKYILLCVYQTLIKFMAPKDKIVLYRGYYCDAINVMKIKWWLETNAALLD